MKMKYEIQLWYRGYLYEGVDLEYVDNEEVKSICHAIIELLAPRYVEIDCEDIHCWYIDIDSAEPLLPQELQKIRILPFPMSTSMFELLPGQDLVEVEVGFRLLHGEESENRLLDSSG